MIAQAYSLRVEGKKKKKLKVNIKYLAERGKGKLLLERRK